ncbi:hypothetical protein [Modestobacter sp. SYSU DS0657]
MTVFYRCDQCGAQSPAESAVGWVEVRALGGHPLLTEPEPTQLCRLCWAHATAGPPRTCPDPEAPQLSEHSQNRDLGQ